MKKCCSIILFFLCICSLNAYSKYEDLCSKVYSVRDITIGRDIFLIFKEDSTCIIDDRSMLFLGRINIANRIIDVHSFSSDNDMNFIAGYAFVKSKDNPIRIYVKRNGDLIWDVGSQRRKYFSIFLSKLIRGRKYFVFRVQDEVLDK